MKNYKDKIGHICELTQGLGMWYGRYEGIVEDHYVLITGFCDGIGFIEERIPVSEDVNIEFFIPDHINQKEEISYWKIFLSFKLDKSSHDEQTMTDYLETTDIEKVIKNLKEQWPWPIIGIDYVEVDKATYDLAVLSKG